MARPVVFWSSAISSSASASWTMQAGSRSTSRASASPSVPIPNSLWGKRHPEAVYHLVTATPEAVQAIGGDELLYADGQARGGAYVAILTKPTNALRLAVLGSMTDPAEAARLADHYAAAAAEASAEARTRAWSAITRDIRLVGQHPDVAALDTLLPWLIHDAMIHLTVPHGLEQYTGAAWGTRDVCQGPVELLLALRHDAPVKDILRTVLAQQYEKSGDWPQWFMLEPYQAIQDRHSHGDVILWPLKSLCDYLEATDDLSFLDERVAWRDEDTLERTAHADTVAAHMEKILATVRGRLIPGTHLLRYGLGDWNDSLQPVDPAMRDRLVSSWTVSLLFQQVGRYARLLERAGRAGRARELDAFAESIRADFCRYLVQDGTVAGYALFEPGQDRPELLLHPADTRTGLRFSLLPMNRGIISGLFSAAEARHHLGLIRKHLLGPDGARLMDRPPTYRGGVETFFRRAESAAFFGREIGLMYVHAHLRYGEAMAVLGEAEALWEAIQVASPIAVTERVKNAGLRQRNAYFSSSDAAFRDRYQASAEWDRVAEGKIDVEGGWRIYSSGPGLFVRLLVEHSARHPHGSMGTEVVVPVLPAGLGPITLEMTIEG